MTSYIVVLITTESKEEAQSIADVLIEDKLAACVILWIISSPVSVGKGKLSGLPSI